MRHTAEFHVTVSAHTGPHGEVPFMVRELEFWEVEEVRKRLAVMVRGLNEYPLLHVEFGESEE